MRILIENSNPLGMSTRCSSSCSSDVRVVTKEELVNGFAELFFSLTKRSRSNNAYLSAILHTRRPLPPDIVRFSSNSDPRELPQAVQPRQSFFRTFSSLHWMQSLYYVGPALKANSFRLFLHLNHRMIRTEESILTRRSRTFTFTRIEESVSPTATRRTKSAGPFADASMKELRTSPLDGNRNKEEARVRLAKVVRALESSCGPPCGRSHSWPKLGEGKQQGRKRARFTGSVRCSRSKLPCYRRNYNDIE